jgi:hypothetical protein
VRRSRLLQTCDRGYFAERNASYPVFFCDFKSPLQFIRIGRLATSCVIFVGNTPLGQSPVPAFTEIAPFLFLQKLTLLA